MRWNSIAEIGSDIENLENLTLLDLIDNDLIELPSEIGRLHNLEEMLLDNNAYLTSIPSEVGLLVNLRTLSLDGNINIKEIPSEIGNIEGLYWLSLWNTGLEDIPDEIEELPNINIQGFGKYVYSALIPIENVQRKTGKEIARILLRRYLRNNYIIFTIANISCLDVECKSISASWTSLGDKYYGFFSYEEWEEYYGLRGPWSGG